MNQTILEPIRKMNKFVTKNSVVLILVFLFVSCTQYNKLEDNNFKNIDNSYFILSTQLFKDSRRLKFIKNLCEVRNLTKKEVEIYETYIMKIKEDFLIDDYYRQYIGYIDCEGKRCLYCQFLLKKSFSRYKDEMNDGPITLHGGGVDIIRSRYDISSNKILQWSYGGVE